MLLKIINHKNILLLLVLLIITLGTPLAFNDRYILFVFIYAVALFVYYKKKLDIIPFIVVIIWGIINLFAVKLNETYFDYYTFIGTTIKILLPYFVLKVIGITLINKFSSIVYFLTVISLPIYILDLLYPNIFESLDFLFNPLTADFLEEKGWHSFIYTYNRTNLRNCGFMWEPGAYAMVLNIAILDILSRNSFKVNYKILILFTALLTTFSTMGYFTLIFFLLIYIIANKNYKLLIFLFPIIFLFFNDLYNLDFISGKINNYIENIDQTNYREEASSYKVNRFSMLKITIQETIAYPFGYGIVPSKYAFDKYGSIIKGVGGLSEILRMWGPLGIVVLIVSVYNYYKLTSFSLNRTFQTLAVLIILFAFFSNPIAKSPIAYFFFYFPYIYKLNSYNNYK